MVHSWYHRHLKCSGFTLPSPRACHLVGPSKMGLPPIFTGHSHRPSHQLKHRDSGKVHPGRSEHTLLLISPILYLFFSIIFRIIRLIIYRFNQKIFHVSVSYNNRIFQIRPVNDRHNGIYFFATQNK